MKFILLCIISVCSLFADFYLFDGTSKVKLSPLETGKITGKTLQNISSMQRANESVKIVSDDTDYHYPFFNIRYVTLGDDACTTVLRDHSDTQLDNGVYLTEFGDIHVSDDTVLQIYYLNRWYGIYLGSADSLQQRILTTTTNSQ